MRVLILVFNISLVILIALVTFHLLNKKLRYELKKKIRPKLSFRYDSNNPRVHGDVGMAGVAVDSVEDMKVLLL